VRAQRPYTEPIGRRQHTRHSERVHRVSGTYGLCAEGGGGGRYAAASSDVCGWRVACLFHGADRSGGGVLCHHCHPPRSLGSRCPAGVTFCVAHLGLLTTLVQRYVCRYTSLLSPCVTLSLPVTSELTNLTQQRCLRLLSLSLPPSSSLLGTLPLGNCAPLHPLCLATTRMIRMVRGGTLAVWRWLA
jgi:hypothetical protein